MYVESDGTRNHVSEFRLTQNVRPPCREPRWHVVSMLLRQHKIQVGPPWVDIRQMVSTGQQVTSKAGRTECGGQLMARLPCLPFEPHLLHMQRRANSVLGNINDREVIANTYAVPAPSS